MPLSEEDQELLAEFLVESAENLDQLDADFLALEAQPDAVDHLASAFRCLHTVKGTAGFFGFEVLQQLSHAAESLMMKARDGELTLTSAAMEALLGTDDEIRSILGDVAETGTDTDHDVSDLVRRLTALCDGRHSDGPSDRTDEGPTGSTDDEPSDLALSVGEPEPGDDPPGSSPPAEADPGSEVAAVDTEPASRGGPARPAETVRVDVELLDELMNLVGELVLTRNQILQHLETGETAALTGASQQLNLITSELQEGVMQTRMQPIDQVFSKFPRIVRDLARELGKDVHLDVVGRDTELDRTLIDAIRDPLTHIVRNAVDHGIERPSDRQAIGKPAHGTLRLAASHESGQVVITISDDGAGLDLDRIRDKAVERGLISAERAAALDDRATAQLVFTPGFSTAATVTNVSGRGVGMDVVRTNIERIGGTVDLHSTPGAGTTITVRIPLTLAIIPALIIRCRTTRFAIPQVNLVELLRIDPSDDHVIEQVNGVDVYRLRGRLLPIIHLDRVLELAPPDQHDSTGPATGAGGPNVPRVHNVVVLTANNRHFGLVVDEISDTQEIVVKPLGSHLKDTRAFAGTTIMGDGSVALILDAVGVAVLGRVLSGPDDMEEDIVEELDPTERRSSTQQLIVCRIGSRQFAIPVALVDRLEQFPAELVERAGDVEVVQYRGRLLSLVRLRTLVPSEGTDRRMTRDESTSTETLQVLVHEHGERLLGLVVDEIIDICNTDITVGEHLGGDGISFSGVIGRRVTDLVNLDEILTRGLPEPVGAEHG